MAYQTKFNFFCNKFFLKNRAGFSLIEILVVIGIFTVLLTVSTSVYNNIKSHSNLDLATNGLVEALRFAQSSAQSGKGDSKWGVEVFSDKVLVFKGNAYLGRDVAFDKVLDFAGGISASGLSEIVFEKLTGATSTVGTVVLSNTSGNKNIYINEKGTVTY